jgi:hypothetical protein
MTSESKYFVPGLAFITDVAMAIYSYFLCTNYEQYKKYAQMAIPDPDFQLQLYKVLLQTMTFVLIIFLFFHLIIYFFYYRGAKFARQYVRFYLIVAVASLAISVLFSFNIYIVLATIAYGICLNKFKIVG